MVVVPEPVVKGGGAFVAVAVDRAVGPAAEHGADEALCFAVGLWPARARAEVADTERSARNGVNGRAVGGAVIGQELLDGDAVASEELNRATKEADRGGRFLVFEDLGVGQSGAVVDGDMHELPAHQPASDAAVLGRGRVVATLARDPMSGAALDAAEFLDVDVDEFAGPGP